MLLYLLSTLIFFGGICLLASFLTVAVHELGHAIPALIWSKKKVTIFIGSYGDPRQSVRWQIGRLYISIKYNPLLWIRGLCRLEETLSVAKTVLYIAMGPLASLTLAWAGWYLLTGFHLDGHLKLFLSILTFLSLVAFLASTIFPDKIRYSANGDRLYNDGRMIIRTLRFGRLWPDYQAALRYIAEKEYDQAARLLNQLLGRQFKNVAIYRASIIVHIQLKNYERALQLCTRLHELYRPNADDYCNQGVIYVQLNRIKEALPCIQQSLEMAPDHPYSLNGMGYLQILLDHPGDAMSYLDKAIRLAPEMAHAYCNRGWAKMQLGQWEDGYADVNYSLTLDDSQADAYRNLGWYHLEKGNGPLARSYLVKARQMDTAIPMVDEYIAEVDQRFPEIID